VFPLTLSAPNINCKGSYDTVCILIPAYSSTPSFVFSPWRCTNENNLIQNARKLKFYSEARIHAENANYDRISGKREAFC